MKHLGTKNIIKQDNTSTIKLVKKGKRTCGQRTRNIDIKYFYVAERVDDGTVNVSYCPTKEMVLDYLSKSLQGSLFRTHRDSIMGISKEDHDRYLMEYSVAKARQADGN